MKRIAILILLICSALTAKPQKEFYNWYFGVHAGFNFHNAPPNAVTDGSLHISDQTSSISDGQGNLLMYSDGLKVWDNTHTQMANGFDLLGSGVTYSHASIIAQQPGSPNLYYIFTLTYFGYAAGLKYAIVDMNLNGGHGDVVSKNNSLLTPVCEKLTAVEHQNGVDIWIITHKWQTNQFYAYLLTSTGISAPVITAIGPVHSGGSGLGYNAAGQLTASCDGSKLAIGTYEQNFVGIYDFDKSTGVISNQIQITGYSRSWGVQFSPDGSKLYVTRWTHPMIYQLDLLAGTPTDIANSAIVVGNATSPDPQYTAGFLQLGPDGKIYVAKYSSGYVGVINNPNAMGLACSFVDNGLYLAGRICHAGLPNYIQTNILYPDFSSQNECIGDSTHFLSVNTGAASSILWDFGDSVSGINNTSTLFNPTHFYSSAGIYNVAMIVTMGVNIDTIQHTVTINQVPVVDLGNDTVLCSQASFLLNAGTSGNSYVWSTGAVSQSLSVDSTNTYWVSVSNGECENSDTINVSFVSVDVELGHDTAICGSPSIVLDAQNSGSAYLWSTGEITQSVTANSSGVYWVSANNSGCIDADTITLYFASPPMVDLGPDTIICIGGSFLLDATNSMATYIWSTGETASSILVDSAGSYFVDVAVGACHDLDTVFYYSPHPIVISNDTALCNGDTVSLSAGGGQTFIWSNTAIGPSITVAPSSSTNYFVTINDEGCTSTSEVTVTVYAKPVVDLGGDIGFCPGDSIILDAGTGFSAYQWQDSSSTQLFTCTTSGGYNVTVVDSNGCIDADTVNVAFLPDVPDPNLGNDTSICEGDTLTLYPGVYGQYNWQNGDTNQFLLALSTGNFSVTVTNAGMCPKVDSIDIEFLPMPPDFDLGEDTLFCGSFSLVLNTASGYDSYLWQNGSTDSVFFATTEGQYYVVATDYCRTTSDSIYITQSDPPVFDLGMNAQLCDNATITLAPGNEYISYLWQDGSSDPSLIVSAAGVYSVTVTDTSGCVGYDSIEIQHNQTPFVELGPDGELCNNNSVLLNAQNSLLDVDYLWQDGSLEQTFLAFTEGVYSVTVSNECGMGTDTIVFEHCPECIVDLPSAFSPNGDGKNDVFRILGQGFTNVHLLIYNRHGELLFETFDASIGWDGFYKGKVQENEVYYYYLSADCIEGESYTKKGDVTLLN